MQDWVKRIYIILGISKLEDVSSPWFLVPAEDQQELSDSEAQGLFGVLRAHLFAGQSRPTVSRIKHSLYSLGDQERVVLLYALRHIALRGAGQNRYWPLCLDMLFDEKIPLESLQITLASALTEQWLHTFRATKGRLFRPKYGKRNIRWPLAHAGLLVRDRQLLDQFFADMAAKYSDEEFQILLSEDYLDNFILELDDWLRMEHHLAEPFAQALLDSERGPTIAELAQQHLFSRKKVEPLNAYRNAQGEFTRRELLYSSSENQLQFRITLQVPYNQGSLSVKWEGGDYQFTTGANGTRYTVVLPLHSSNWAGNVAISGGFSRSVRLPPLSLEPMIFDGANDRRIRRWQQDGSYYILFPPKYQSTNYQKYLTTLFTDLHDCGPVKGEWAGYTLIWAQLAKPKRDESDISGRTIEALNEAADHLDLPTLESLWRPQASLVGGTLLSMGETPSYDVADPPFIQIQGVWEVPLNISYQIWDRERKRFTPFAALTVSAQHTQQHKLLAVDSAHLSPNQIYRICIDEEPGCQWQTMAGFQAIQSKRLLATIQVEYNGEVIDQPNHFHLASGSLIVRAWSNAEIELFATDGNHQHKQTIWLGNDGETRIKWTETALSQLGDDNISVQVRWRGLPVSQVLQCQAATTLLPDDIEIEFRIDKPDTLDIIAVLRDFKNFKRVLVIVLGSQPWDGQIWQSTASVERDGSLITSVNTSHKFARWLLICRQQNGKKPEVLAIKSIPQDSLNLSLMRRIQTGKTQRQWRECTTFLASVPLPLDLQRLVHWQQILEIFDSPNIRQLNHVSWQPITTGSQIVRLQNWLRLGVQVPYALCEWIPSEGAFNPKATVLVPADLLSLQQALQQPSATLPLHIRRPNGTQHIWTAGELVIANDDGEHEFRIRSRQRLCVCPECRTVLPTEQFNAHENISVLRRVCTQSRQIASVESPKVYFVALFDACELLRFFARSILALLNGYRNELHDTISTLLEEVVYPFYERSGGIDERSWLLGLCQAVDIFIDIVNDTGTTFFASQDVKNILQYKGVIDTLLLRIQEW